MKNINFIIKSLSLALMIAVLVVYGTAAAKRDRHIKAHAEQKAEIEAHNAEVLRLLNEAEEASSKYADGVYEGSANGFKGELEVKVTVSGGSIVDIEILSSSDDAAFLAMARSVIDSIISTQSTEVDVASGATYSSNGIINAVTAALSEAEG